MDTRNFTLSSSNISDRYTYNVSIKGIECIEDLIDRFSGQVNSFLLINYLVIMIN